jgi:hypothetical protein
MRAPSTNERTPALAGTRALELTVEVKARHRQPACPV